MPFSQRIGFATVVASTRSSRIGPLLAAIRPANPVPTRDANALADLFLESRAPPSRRVHRRAFGEQQDRRGIRVESCLDPTQQLIEQVIDIRAS